MAFNADEFASDFMSSTIEGPMATKRKPVDEGVYLMTILDEVDGEDSFKKIETVGGVSEKDPANPRPWLRLNVPMKIVTRLDEAMDQSAEGRIVRYSFFLDINDNGSLRLGEEDNLHLGRLRKAVSQNEGTWNPHMLGGQQVTAQIKHRVVPAKPGDLDQDPTIYAEVDSVTSASGTGIA